MEKQTDWTIGIFTLMANYINEELFALHPTLNACHSPGTCLCASVGACVCVCVRVCVFKQSTKIHSCWRFINIRRTIIMDL